MSIAQNNCYMDEYILKHLQDILNAISDLEKVFEGYPMRFDVFEKDDLHRWAVERKTEIMGEAMTRIRKHNPEFVIPNGHGVIATRNRLIHSYEYVEPSFLWSLVIRHIPQLRQDIIRLIDEAEKDANSPGL